MKYFTIIALLLSFNSFANIFEKINCGSYETTKYPNKTVFKGTVKSEVTEVGVKEFFETAQNDSKQIMWKLELLDRATGKYKKSFPRSSPYSDQKTAIEHQIIQPHVVINLGKKAITGSNNGEFGGELLLIDENDKVTLIQRMNVKDIFEMPFGLVVTSGLSHLSWNYGDIHFIKADNVYLEVNTVDKKFLVRSPLKDYLEKLPKNKFYRAHKSYIVNVDHIDAINSKDIMINNTLIPISKDFKEFIISAMNS